MIWMERDHMTHHPYDPPEDKEIVKATEAYKRLMTVQMQARSAGTETEFTFPEPQSQAERAGLAIVLDCFEELTGAPVAWNGIGRPPAE